MTWRNRRRSREVHLSESKKTLLEAISTFQAAQCYFSVALDIAAFYTDPFSLDPLNAFGLLPVSVNGFMPEIMTLMILNHHERRHWYPLLLTWTSYILNSVNFWAVRGYLSIINSDTVGMKRPAFESLGGIASCGGTTGLTLCLQFQQESPPTFLIRKYGEAALLGVKLAPAVWAWCTFCLLLLTYFQLQKSEVGIKVKRPSWRRIRGRCWAFSKDSVMKCCAVQSSTTPPNLYSLPVWYTRRLCLCNSSIWDWWTFRLGPSVRLWLSLCGFLQLWITFTASSALNLRRCTLHGSLTTRLIYASH